MKIQIFTNTDVLGFEKWLKQNGCEILPPTNPFELLRWKGSETGVLYNTGKTSGQYALKAYLCYKSSKKWDGATKSTKRKTAYHKEKSAIYDRDGGCCFYCGNPLKEDITIEHLIPLTAGGTNLISNMVLAHYNCNNEAGHLTVSEKVKLAIFKRTKL